MVAWQRMGPARPTQPLLGGSFQAHLHGLNDDGEGVVPAVPDQLVLADPAEGEVPAVKALEVGLSYDETLSWGHTEKGRKIQEEGGLLG